MGYLAINMSGTPMNVYATSGGENLIGKIYHKERFSNLNPRGWATAIQFLNSSNQYVIGYCFPGTNQSMDWINYAFHHGSEPYIGFYTDAPVNIYNSGGLFIRTIPAGCFLVPTSDDYTEIGSSHTDWLRIREIIAPGASHYISCDYGFFADCKISSNSTNTPVYGNWN